MSEACQALRYDCQFAFYYLQTAYFYQFKISVSPLSKKSISHENLSIKDKLPAIGFSIANSKCQKHKDEI